MVNKLVLRGFYEQHKSKYIEMRSDPEQWDESYKWDILPRLNTELQLIDTITSDNALGIVELLQKNNPNAGTFCHWTDFDNLHKQLVKNPTASKALPYLWGVSPDTVGDEINAVNNLLHSLFQGEFKLSPAAFGYFLAAQDCNKFALYRDTLLTDLVDINLAPKPKNQGEKYQLLNDSAYYIGSLMAEEKDLYANQEFYTALNGQDFLYVIIQYPKESA